MRGFEVKLTIFSSLMYCFLMNACIPEPDTYPYKPAAEIRNEAQEISANLQSYIEGWLDGINPAQIPLSLIPEGVNNVHSFELVHPDSASYEETWAWRYAKPINTDSIYNSIPDPNVTYLLLGPALAPFGSKIYIEGQFPYCRFFSLQITPPLSGEEYTFDRTFGAAEVSIVDVDINPLPGHTNPFRIGTNRNAINRSYQVVFNLEIGNAVELSNNNFAPPFRYPGNERFGGMFQYQGPWGVNGGFGGFTPGSGEWTLGNLWLRIYAPDDISDPLGNVPPPKVYYELPDGRKYFIRANFDDFKKIVDKTVPAQETYTFPNPNLSLDRGWQKSYGVLMNILSGVAQVNNWIHPDSLSKIRAVDLGVTGRSQNSPPPRNYEAHATVNNYTSYLGKFVRLDTGMVAVFTGKLPTFPDTRSGISSMTDAQCRYWSIVGYDNDPFFVSPGSAVNSILDEEVELDENRNFIIAFSREEDKPNNAELQNKVTWVDWGPTMDLGFILRIVTLGDIWNFDQSPTAPSLPWKTGNFPSPDYDSTLINQNWHKGYMGCYLPRLHILTKDEFQNLGNNFRAQDIPILITKEFKIGLNDALNSPISASSEKNNSTEFAVSNANDNDFESIWSSQDLNNPCQEEWVEIDLQAPHQISGLKLAWVFFANAIEYQIETSLDGINYEIVYETTNGDGGNDIISGLDNIQAQYIRIKMNCSIFFNYALHNIELYIPELNCLELTTNTENISDEINNTAILFPNPTSNIVNVNTENPEYFSDILVYDFAGRLINKMPFIEQIELTGESGIYFIVLTGQNKKLSFKIVKL